MIKTKNFELAVYRKGDENSPRLALVLPGRLDTRDYPHMKSHVDFLASKGYLALSFDPPGIWESPGGIEIYTMTNYLKAVNELIDYFGNRATLVIGHSRGGSIAVLAGVKNSAVKAIINIMSSLSPSEYYKNMKPGDVKISYRDLPGGGETKKKFELPHGYFEDALKFDVLGELKNCSKPKLFFFSSQDTFVKPELAEKIFATASEPKFIHKLKTEHDYRYHPEVVSEVNKTIWDFIEKFS